MFVSVTVRVTGYVVVNGCLSCCLWVEGSMSYHVSEGDWFSSGCGVPSCHSSLGDCPLVDSWNGASPPTPCGASCLAQQCPPYVLLGPVGPGALQQLTFLLTRAVCCPWKTEADGADSLGLSDVYRSCTSISPSPCSRTCHHKHECSAWM